MGSIDWAVPWGTEQIINFGCLLTAALIVTAVPVYYAIKANIRDPLARAILSGTGATAIAFLLVSASTVAFHAGWNPPHTVWSWITRLMFLTVALGKFVLLTALMKVLREEKDCPEPGPVDSDPKYPADGDYAERARRAS